MNGTSPGPAYELQRSTGPPHNQQHTSSGTYASDASPYSESLDDQISFVAASSVTAGAVHYRDATKAVHEMHLALLYLLSNPDEFHKALQAHPPRGATTLADWNASYEDSNEDASTVAESQTPLPFVVFADDAEVVLPQAHTASQLFGIEKVEGIELEAAAGVPALSQLFLRWLAVMPGGDHMNIIDPPGLTVMRIAGGRYRVTAAHRVVWTWMNEFALLSDASAKEEGESAPPQVGDLVTMTIVDVFETDNNGKLLSYCPTFDNRDIRKTHQASESIRKGSSMFMGQLSAAAKSPAAKKVNQAAAHMTRMSIHAAKSMADSVKGRIDEQLKTRGSPRRGSSEMDSNVFEQALTEAEAAATSTNAASAAPKVQQLNGSHSDMQ